VKEISDMELYKEMRATRSSPQAFNKACKKILGKAGYSADQVPQEYRKQIIDHMHKHGPFDKEPWTWIRS